MMRDGAIEVPFDTKRIEEIIPHRPPFLFVERVLEIEPGRRILATKSVRAEEEFFKGHFPGRPIMPGVLMVEAIAQAGAIMVLVKPEFAGKVPILAGLNNARFRKIVVPGNLLTIEVELEAIKMGIGRGYGKASVDGQIAVEGDIRFAFIDA